MADPKAPMAGQPAALVRDTGGAWLAQYPYEVAGGRDAALSHAKRWRDSMAPAASVVCFTGEFLPVFDYSDGLKTYTAFVRQKDGKGTTWIDDVEGRDIEEANLNAEIKCAADWDCSHQDVICVGLAEGVVQIANWED